MNTLMASASSIMRSLRADAERGMASYGLGHPEQMVLMSLYPDKVFNQDSIAQTLNVDKGAIARTLSKLEGKGYITRIPNPDNRRENLVSLAPKSEDVLQEMQKNLKACDKRAFKGFSEEERASLLEMLDRVSVNLC